MLDFKAGFYEKLFRALGSNAALLRVGGDGSCRPVWCSRGFAKVMESSEEDILQNGVMDAVHPDDREDAAYLLRHHKTREGLIRDGP